MSRFAGGWAKWLLWLGTLAILLLLLYVAGGPTALLQLGRLLALIALPFVFGAGLQVTLGGRHIPAYVPWVCAVVSIAVFALVRQGSLEAASQELFQLALVAYIGGNLIRAGIASVLLFRIGLATGLDDGVHHAGA